jgi:hypothetical protein
MSIVDVSIIIVSWNIRDLLKDCIHSVFETVREVSFEIWVVDNNSSDGTVRTVNREFPRVNVIANSENRGFAVANNQAIRKANGRYILLLNPDTLVMPDTIDTMIRVMDARPNVGVAGCKILNADGSLQHSCYHFYSALDLLWQATYLDRLLPPNSVTGRYRMLYWNHDEIREDIDRILGAFFLVRSEALDAVGLLNEAFFWAQEEEEWCYRAKQQGWQVLFYPDVAIVHYGGASAIQRKADTIIFGFIGRDYFFRRYYEDRYEIYWVFSVFEVLIRLIVWNLIRFFSPRNVQADTQLKAYVALFQYLVLPQQFKREWESQLNFDFDSLNLGEHD